MTNGSHRPIDHVTHCETLCNLIGQNKFGEITNPCAIHVKYFVSLETPSKQIRKTIPFLYDSAANTKLLEFFERKLLSVLPSDCANEDVNHLIKSLMETIDEYTIYSEAKQKQKNSFLFDSSFKIILIRRKVLFVNYSIS